MKNLYLLFCFSLVYVLLGCGMQKAVDSAGNDIPNSLNQTNHKLDKNQKALDKLQERTRLSVVKATKATLFAPDNRARPFHFTGLIAAGKLYAKLLTANELAGFFQGQILDINLPVPIDQSLTIDPTACKQLDAMSASLEFTSSSSLTAAVEADRDADNNDEEESEIDRGNIDKLTQACEEHKIYALKKGENVENFDRWAAATFTALKVIAGNTKQSKVDAMIAQQIPEGKFADGSYTFLMTRALFFQDMIHILLGNPEKPEPKAPRLLNLGQYERIVNLLVGIDLLISLEIRPYIGAYIAYRGTMFAANGYVFYELADIKTLAYWKRAQAAYHTRLKPSSRVNNAEAAKLKALVDQKVKLGK